MDQEIMNYALISADLCKRMFEYKDSSIVIPVEIPEGKFLITGQSLSEEEWDAYLKRAKENGNNQE